MNKEHFLYKAETGARIGTFVQYGINGMMSPEEIDIIQDALNFYKTKLQEEPCFSKLLKESKNIILKKIDCLITKFDTMD